jgi:hypothetical protein
MENTGKSSEENCILCKHYNFQLAFCRVHNRIVPDYFAVKKSCQSYEIGYIVVDKDKSMHDNTDSTKEVHI